MEAGKQGSCHSSRSPQPGPSDGWWPHLSVSQVLSQRTCTVQALLCPQNTGRTEAWKVLSPQGGPWDSVARVLPNGSLLLPAVGIQDEGTFRCRATSRNGKETRSTYQVRVYRKSSRAISMAYLSSQEKPSTLALDSWPWCVRTCTPGVEESVKLQPLTEIFSTSEIPGKPEIINPASELMAGVPSKVKKREAILRSGRGYKAGGGCACMCAESLIFKDDEGHSFPRWGHVCLRGAILQGLLAGTGTGNPSYLMAKVSPKVPPPGCFLSDPSPTPTLEYLALSSPPRNRSLRAGGDQETP